MSRVLSCIPCLGIFPGPQLGEGWQRVRRPEESNSQFYLSVLQREEVNLEGAVAPSFQQDAGGRLALANEGGGKQHPSLFQQLPCYFPSSGQCRGSASGLKAKGHCWLPSAPETAVTETSTASGGAAQPQGPWVPLAHWGSCSKTWKTRGDRGVKGPLDCVGPGKGI